MEWLPRACVRPHGRTKRPVLLTRTLLPTAREVFRKDDGTYVVFVVVVVPPCVEERMPKSPPLPIRTLVPVRRCGGLMMAAGLALWVGMGKAADAL